MTVQLITLQLVDRGLYTKCPGLWHPETARTLCDLSSQICFQSIKKQGGKAGEIPAPRP